MLVAHLPRESATFYATNPETAAWGIAEQLMATVADTVAVGNWQYAAAHVKKGTTLPPPEPIPRPGVAPRSHRRRIGLSPEQIHARLLAQRAAQDEGGD